MPVELKLSIKHDDEAISNQETKISYVLNLLVLKFLFEHNQSQNRYHGITGVQ